MNIFFKCIKFLQLDLNQIPSQTNTQTKKNTAKKKYKKIYSKEPNLSQLPQTTQKKKNTKMMRTQIHHRQRKM